MLHCAICRLRLAEQVSLRLQVQLEQWCHLHVEKIVLTVLSRSFGSERVQQWMVATVTQGAYMLYHFIKGYYFDCVSGS